MLIEGVDICNKLCHLMFALSHYHEFRLTLCNYATFDDERGGFYLRYRLDTCVGFYIIILTSNHFSLFMKWGKFKLTRAIG